MLLPPGVAEGELNAGIDAGVTVSERCAGDVDGVGTEVDGATGADEVVSADAELGSEVPNACVSVGAVILLVVGWSAECWVFVVGPEKTASGLRPEGKALRANYVPAKNDRGDGYTSKRAAHSIKGCAHGWSTGFIDTKGALELGRVGLPEWENLNRVLKVAAERPPAVVASENFAGVHAREEKLKVVAVFSDAEATLNERAYFEVVKV